MRRTALQKVRGCNRLQKLHFCNRLSVTKSLVRVQSVQRQSLAAGFPGVANAQREWPVRTLTLVPMVRITLKTLAVG